MNTVNKILKPKKHLLFFYRIKELWNNKVFWFRVKFVIVFPFSFWKFKKTKIKLVENHYKNLYMLMFDPSFEDYTRLQKRKFDMLYTLNLWRY
jgi:hypothetical protein